MAVIHGRRGKVSIGSNFIARVQNFNINPEVDTVEADAMGSEWGEHVVDPMKRWSASVSCLYDPADTDGQATLIVGSEVTLTVYPGGNDSGNVEFTGVVTITSKPITVNKDGLVEVSFEGKGQGALTEGVVA